MAKHFNIEALNVDTPLSYEFSFDPHEEGNELEDEGDLSKRIKEYRERVGALQYLANSSRPDLSFASNYLSRFCLYPHRDLKRQLDRCIGYALKTRNHSIKYSYKWNPDHEYNHLIGFSDASHGGDKCNRKSTSGCIFMYGGGPIYWCSRVAKIAAISSTEAELVSMVDAGHELITLREAMILLGLVNEEYSDQYSPPCSIWLNQHGELKNNDSWDDFDKDGYNDLHSLKKFLIMVDNTPAIQLSKSLACRGRTRYMGTRIAKANELVNKKWIKFEYINTKDMLADILTKPVTPAVLNHLIPKIFRR
ncbi:unnamed protein product [Ambrosiozyma monospora]|uniref:Unnamed protein product n=1 Tax=Ambrosiozyma monospora TaxID=43982 RepID=A0A9W6TA28_AMBMO|nr:unnamed protein product [Ambrosiozyma monospora]